MAATVTEVNQTAVNGMNSNGKDHDDHMIGEHDSPSKTAVSNSQEAARIAAKMDIHKEKTPEPERADEHASTTESTSKEASPEKKETPAAPETKVVEPSGVVVEPEETRKAEDETPAEPVAAVVEPSKPAEKEAHKPEDTTDAAKPEKKDDVADKQEKIEAEKKEVEKSATEAPSEELKPAEEKEAETVKKTPVKRGGRKAQKVPAEDEVDAEKSSETPTTDKRTPRKRKTTSETQEASPDDADKTPLLEAPLIVEGKRQRHRVERLDSTVLTPEKKEIEIPHGKGVKLSEIAFVEAMISKTMAYSIKILHRICFGKVASIPESKKHLRLFNGFDFDKDSKEYEKKKKSMESISKADLGGVCAILGLNRTEKKDDLIECILAYLIKPEDKGKSVPSSTKRGAKKRPAPSSGSRRTPGRKAKKGTGDASEEESAEDEAGEDHEEKDEGSAAEDDKQKSEAEESEPAPKRGRKSGKAAATPKKPAAKSAKKSAFPSDADLKATIKELLKGVNLEQVTMKEMTTKVYDKYPDVDLTNKKDFIKETVKTLLQSNE